MRATHHSRIACLFTLEPIASPDPWLLQVVRCFDDPDVIHVDGSVDPVRDMEVINLELVLADLAQVRLLTRCSHTPKPFDVLISTDLFRPRKGSVQSCAVTYRVEDRS